MTAVERSDTNNTTITPPIPGATPLCEIPLLRYSDNGGMIFFWHIPKTGGSTLRERYKSKFHPNVQRWVSMGLSDQEYQTLQQRAQDTFLAANHTAFHGKTLFWEVHGGPSLNRLKDDLHHWRRIADQNNKTFFSFTLFREGPSAAMSYFNFYCPPCDHPALWKGYGILENSKANFLRSSATWANYQTRMLHHGRYVGFRNWTSGVQSIITWEESQNLYKNSALDWIGTTETMSKQTIPILEYLVTGKKSNALGFIRNEKVAAERRVKDGNKTAHVSADQFLPEEQTFVWEKMSLDQAIWELARQDYYWTMDNPDVIRRPCQ